jgi:hypothetical protein
MGSAHNLRERKRVVRYSDDTADGGAESDGDFKIEDVYSEPEGEIILITATNYCNGQLI